MPREETLLGETVWTSQPWAFPEVRVRPLRTRAGGDEDCGSAVVLSRYLRTWSRVLWSLLERRMRMIAGIMRVSALIPEERSRVPISLVITAFKPFDAPNLVEQS